MAKRPDFEPVKTWAGWMISVPPSLTADGHRARRFFPDLSEAKKFAASMRSNHSSGVRGGLITASIAAQATLALKILKGTGIDLVHAANLVKRQFAKNSDRETLRQRYHQCLLDGESRWSSRYTRDMGKIELWVGKEAMGMFCGELTPEVLDDLLRRHGAAAVSTLSMRRSRVMAVLNWKPVVRRVAKSISILSPEQVAAVLAACDGAIEQRTVALLIYAGIRPDAEEGEIRRLDWSAFSKTDIYVSPEVSKVGERHIPITPALRKLIKGHPASGPVAPANWKKQWQRIRKTAGIAALQDVCRHTFGSYYLAAYGEDAAKQAMGHTAGSRVLFQHYRRAVKEEDGLRFFTGKSK